MSTRLRRHHGSRSLRPADRQLQPLEARRLLSQVAFGVSATQSVVAGTVLPAIAAADFNQDGRTDVAVVNNTVGTSTFSVFMANANGTFAPKVDYSAGAVPRGILAADLNGDSYPDIISGAPGGMKVCLNNGDGTFAAGTIYTHDGNSTSVRSIISGDFNNDGYPDLAFPSTGGIVVYLNNGNGTFGNKQLAAAVSNGNRITSADFNGDGFLDLAMVTFSNTDLNVYVMMGNGDGTFGAAVTYPVLSFTFGVLARDFNGDGRPDMAVTSTTVGGKLGIYINNGDGTFAPRVDYTSGGVGPAVLGDFNNDGKTDILGLINGNGNTLQLFAGNGDGTFAARASLTINNYAAPAGLITADFNNDGNLDVAYNSADNFGQITSFSTALNLGTLNYSPRVDLPAPSNYITTVAVDLNNDQLPDLAFADNFNSVVSVELNLGNGQFAPKADYTAAHYPSAIAGRDLNHDSFADLVVSSYSGIGVFLNNHDGTFAARIDVPATSGPGALDIADVNQDTFPDVVGLASNAIYVYLNDGNGNFTVQSQSISSLSNVTSIIAADFNNDGKRDVAYPTSSGFSVQFNTGSGTFGSPVNYSLSLSNALLVTADFNGDGIADIAAAGFADHNVDVLLNNGTGTFGAAVPYLISSNYYANSLVAADLNGDGRTDLAANIQSNTITPPVAILLNTGNGTFGGHIDFTTASNAKAILAADVDGDGRQDLLTVNSFFVSVLTSQSIYRAPRITSVYINDSNWSPQFHAFISNLNQSDSALGYRIPLGTNQLKPVPWMTLNQISIVFNEPVNIQQSALALSGFNLSNYDITNFSYNAATRTATWTLAVPIPADRLTLSIAASAVTDAAGRQLDGEWTDSSSLVSGNGASGGNALFHLNVLPADTNQDGIVDGADFDAWFAHLGFHTFAASQGDLNADGVVDGADFDIWFTHLLNTVGAAPTSLSASITSNVQPVAPATITSTVSLDEVTAPKSRSKQRIRFELPSLLHK